MNKAWTVIIRTQGLDNDLELKNAINSVIAQGYENISIIIAIHTNKEERIKETLSFLKAFDRSIKIQPIVIKEKQGVRSYPLNVALKKLSSEYVSFLDHDDIYYPHMGNTLIYLMEKNNKSFAYGTSIKVLQEKVTDNWGHEYLYTKEKSRFETKDFNIVSFFLDNYIPFNTIILRASLLKEMEFNEKLDYLEDWDFLRRIALKKDFSLIQTKFPVSEYRVRNDNTDTYNDDNYKKWVKSRERTDRNISSEKITIDVNEILAFRKEYLQEIESLHNEINKLELNPAYRLWKTVRDNKIINKTIVRFIRITRDIKSQ